MATSPGYAERLISFEQLRAAALSSLLSYAEPDVNPDAGAICPAVARTQKT